VDHTSLTGSHQTVHQPTKEQGPSVADGIIAEECKKEIEPLDSSARNSLHSLLQSDTASDRDISSASPHGHPYIELEGGITQDVKESDAPITDDWELMSQLTYSSDIESIVDNGTSELGGPSNVVDASSQPSREGSSESNKTRVDNTHCATTDPLPDSVQTTERHASIWNCRLCDEDPVQPVATICGHIFCHRCIMEELSKNLKCPTCNHVMLIRLDI